MPIKILIATDNPGKIAEIKQIFTDYSFELLFKKDLPQTKNLEIVEDADTLEGNALLKAKTNGQASGLITLADDSGLFVEALDGRPGVHSARYTGHGDEANNIKILAEMQSVPEEKRDCYYEGVVAIYDPQTNWQTTVSGRWYGRIGYEPRGTGGFGYAPIFLCRDYDYTLTNAELDEKRKLAVNHRGKAFRAAKELLEAKYLTNS
ncbi:MAG: RdgB/HAM1 family non-canonical purine NTP pyrophosphatase [Patescibacteria group bacterium]